MKKIIVIGIAVFVLLILGVFTGIIPLGDILDDGTTTINHHVGDILGYGELITEKSFICSYMDDGHSQKITIQGRCVHKGGGFGVDTGFREYRYKVFGRTDAWSDWDPLSVPGDTKKYIAPANPDEISTPGGNFADSFILRSGGVWNANSYSFTMMGDEYEAIRVLFEGLIDWNIVNPWDDGYKWRTIASDEAYLYSGYGGIYLPRGVEDGVDRTYDTFEVGQEVDIRVETAKGGSASKPWRVTLNEPYGGDIEYPDDGGGVIVEKFYENDVTNGHFRFTVTEEMATKSMQSSDPYTIRFWNTLLPKGSLYVDFLDFIVLAPSDVDFSIDGKKIAWGEDIAIQTRVGETFSVDLSATSNVGIDYFRISVVYGVAETMLPSDPLSKLWLINTCNVGDKDGGTCSIPYTIDMVPRMESFFTIHAKAFDLDGRGSPRTATCEVYTSFEPVPDETIEKTTGVDDYGGGKSPGWMPWDPSGGSWEITTGGELIIDWLGVLIMIFIIAGMALIGLFVFKEPKIIVIMTIAGIVIAVLVYAFFFTTLLS